MSQSPFVAPFERLPETLPIFPLSGAIVMPGSELPLNIFEPRYLNMVSDSLRTHHMIGMIQPNPAARDETGLCRTGCAGRITRYRETADGRIEMVLSGVCRYDVGEELPTTRGYRLIIPDWSRFRADYAEHERLLREQQGRLIRILKRYFNAKQLNTDWNMLESLPTMGLVNSLTMVLPLSEQYKQALLETVDPGQRLHTFTEMLESELRGAGSVIRR